MSNEHVYVAVPEAFAPGAEHEPPLNFSTIGYSKAEALLRTDKNNCLVIIAFSSDILLARQDNPTLETFSRLSTELKSLCEVAKEFPDRVVTLDGLECSKNPSAASSLATKKFGVEIDLVALLEGMSLPDDWQRLRSLALWGSALSPTLIHAMDALVDISRPLDDTPKVNRPATITNRFLEILDVLQADLTQAEARHQIDHLMITQMQLELDYANDVIDQLQCAAVASKVKSDSYAGKWWFRALLGKKTRRQMKAIEQAAEFDGRWYVATYKDVANGHMPAAYHYLKFGAREGRDPSSHFSTRRYAWLHPDVDFSVTNPLLHYLGKQ